MGVASYIGALFTHCLTMVAQLTTCWAQQTADRCGPEARYWQARRISARAWMIGLAILGHALAIVYFSYLWGR